MPRYGGQHAHLTEEETLSKQKDANHQFVSEYLKTKRIHLMIW
ncbi:hypothetical protein ACVPOQ_11475 [Staphylococcus aureus]